MKLPRRSFLTLASGLLVPHEPERVYSFMPGYRLMPRDRVEHLASFPTILTSSWPLTEAYACASRATSGPGPSGSESVKLAAYLTPELAHDYRESARVYGIPLRFA